MKKLLSFTMFCVVLVSVKANHGKRIEYPKFKWVNILNKSITNGNTKLGIDEMYITRDGKPLKGNTCSIGSSENIFYSNLRVIGELQDGEYIFEYTREGIAYGAPCPSGVFFKAKLEDVYY
jgi:hypothetical protein